MKLPTSLFASPKFFRVTLAVFWLNALWIAFSGAFPMAFDEGYHLDIIRLYAQKWLPFWAGQPENVDHLGAVFRDPSYLWHYLMSFPYRLFAHFVPSEMAQVIFLRILDIAIFTCGLLLYRKVLSRAGVSKKLLNVIFLLFVLTPAVPFLAGQVNYDNLLFVAVAGILLLTQNFAGELAAKKRFNLRSFVLLAGTALLCSLVKYAFLPVLFAIGVYLLYVFTKFMKRTTWQRLKKDVVRQYRSFSRIQVVVAAVFLLMSGGLFFERYGMNTIRYHTPTPECDQVLSVERCMSYSPWRRNYLTYLDKQSGTLKKFPTNPLWYGFTRWGHRMTNQLFFTIDGTSSNYQSRNPLVITRIVSVGVLAGGLGLFLFQLRRIRRYYALGLFLAVAFLYTVILFLQNYLEFLHLGYPFAIQGRYLIAVLPLYYLFIALGVSRVLQNYSALKPALAWGAIIFLCTQGGGAGVYILKSQESWNWPNETVQSVNNWMRTFLHHFTIGR